MNEGKWTISQSDEYFNECEFFNSKEEAINFGKRYEEFEGEGFYVGKVKEVKIMASALGDWTIEKIQDIHCDNHGEFAADYLLVVNQNHIDELDNAIEKVITNWADKHKYQPNYFLVNEIEWIEGA